MIRRLIILLLIVGCDNSTEPQDTTEVIDVLGLQVSYYYSGYHFVENDYHGFSRWNYYTSINWSVPSSNDDCYDDFDFTSCFTGELQPHNTYCFNKEAESIKFYFKPDRIKFYEFRTVIDGDERDWDNSVTPDCFVECQYWLDDGMAYDCFTQECIKNCDPNP